MDKTLYLDRADVQGASGPAAAMARRAARARLPDDAALLRAAADLSREYARPSRVIYWTDMLGSAALGYGALAGAILLPGAAAWLSGVIAVFALYRAGLFIHEITHIKHELVPGFRLVWNALVGVPLLVPSFLYEGIHTTHHARTRYGTADDPEYLPLALMKPWTLPVFVVVALFAPAIMLVRFALLTPLSLIIPRLRTFVVQRWSGLQINPLFRRRAPEDAFRRQWAWQEGAASIWAIALLVMILAGVIPPRAFLIGLAIVSAVMLLNQIRTLVAHLWENEGEPMTVTGQYLDSVNVPPPGLLPALWAPVGLRYHALHHLLPSVPYHALGKAHRRLAALDQASVYHQSNYRGLPILVGRLVASTMGKGRSIPRYG